MAFKLIDLLPPERKRAFLHTYFFRLGTVAATLLAVLLLIHGIMLAPAYFNLAEAKSNELSRLNSIKERLASSGDQEIIGRLTSLSAESTHLGRLGEVPSATATMRTILSLPRSGIVLIGFSFTPPNGKTPGRMGITGTATSREALRAYQSTLTTMPSVTSVDLPISAYAKESDIPFTITLTGSFDPTP